MEENKLLCCVCGRELAPDEAFEFEDDVYCFNCYENETVSCDCCGERIRQENAVSDDDLGICQNCYDNEYSRCEECGRLIHNDETYYIDDDYDYPYCYNCYHEKYKCKIHNYSYKPDPIFYGKGKRYFGIELEVDNGGRYSDNAEKVLQIVNNSREDRLYIKEDSSLCCGFEMVSHPMTLDYHINEMPWAEIMQLLISLGYLSHKSGTCGLHCHINRTAFGDSYEEQEDAIARILYFVEHHWDKILKFSRRTEAQMERWAARYGIKGKPKKLYDDVKKDNYSRYRAVNIKNYATIEFRMFRGTLKYNSFAATLQFVDEICSAAVSMSDEEMENLTWKEFVKNIKAPELIQYLKERNLYIEEEV